MDRIDSHRPPRIFLIERTSVGKSSLINAICGSYIAKVSDTHSCTERTQTYKCMDGDRVLMEICDTRGIAESESINDEVSAEEMRYAMDWLNNDAFVERIVITNTHKLMEMCEDYELFDEIHQNQKD